MTASNRRRFCLIGTSSGLPFVRNGQLQAVAVSSLKRYLEAGGKDSDANDWNGMLEPAPLSPGAMDAMMKREIDLNIKIAKAAGLKFNRAAAPA